MQLFALRKLRTVFSHIQLKRLRNYFFWFQKNVLVVFSRMKFNLRLDLDLYQRLALVTSLNILKIIAIIITVLFDDNGDLYYGKIIVITIEPSNAAQCLNSKKK